MSSPRPSRPRAPRILGTEVVWLRPSGAVWIPTPLEPKRTEYGHYLAAVFYYRDWGEEEDLPPFRGKGLVVDGRFEEYLTDLDALDRLIDAGMLHFERASR
jgi:hypothetical protein